MKNLQIAIKAAKIASVIIKKYYAEPDIAVKGVKDVVTNADIEAENAIRKFLLSRTKYGFIGEETGKKAGNPTWIVDPIDGTRPFCFGIPYFSTTIALISNNETIIGVVYNPVTEELYTAIKGKGAFLNGKRLLAKIKRPLKESIIGCAFVYGRKELLELEKSVNICMVNFSCALDVCKAAAGRIDAAVYGLSKVYSEAENGILMF